MYVCETVNVNIASPPALVPHTPLQSYECHTEECGPAPSLLSPSPGEEASGCGERRV